MSEEYIAAIILLRTCFSGWEICCNTLHIDYVTLAVGKSYFTHTMEHHGVDATSEKKSFFIIKNNLEFRL